MKAGIFSIVLLFLGFAAKAQDPVQDSIATDSIAFNMQLQEIVLSNVKDTLSEETKKQLLLLRRRVLKVYPFAKVAAERLVILNSTMSKLKTDREKKKYSKIVEKYMEEEFEGQLKKLSRKEGQILVKLVYRQTGQSTFDLIKEHKSGWKAFWYSKIGKAFSIDIKAKYSPDAVAEDFLIEGFLLKAFDEHKLPRQEPALKIDYVALKKVWRERNKKDN
ncbi:hypothetical protein Q765_11690 [Flavobacterium rivuli WB 3.3-2 = DSM 21788]|uniref:DUF4294 domain-containing protein n=1 Tax=Flavobacterium rivuli WB 3.3-2 = DSM 21788 TaxID=1121895 RepID=A0A0A2M483_9FLAO|nr:DUF4294 domain-containing protein [Flavobacterium rivuli]KGO86238.1 hypothetical protein Q765_11690 [Flavobacterium rivuli WB 3.3-2 = DSM 21788]